MNLLFVCTGNLCRSPMAEALVRKFASREGYGDIQARSAGTHAIDGNLSPPEAQKVAETVGVNLALHRAQPVTQELLDWSDRIVVMSSEHTDFIKVNFPEAVDKVEELGRYRPGGRPGDEIKDPYGLSLFHYRQFYGELMEALQNYYSQLISGRA